MRRTEEERKHDLSRHSDITRYLSTQALVSDMMLPPAVQTLVDQMIQVLGLQAQRPVSLELHFDRDGIVQDLKSTLSYRREKKDLDKTEDIRA